MTSEGFGEMFEGAGKFPLVSMGAKRRVSRAQTRERGPPSALVEIIKRVHCVSVIWWLILKPLDCYSVIFYKLFQPILATVSLISLILPGTAWDIKLKENNC